ncbi:MAG: hypothetical protein H6Q66_2912 [Firmicutes bacterium]|nr:hypothetical protein [Bacillota bacterium]
MTVYCVVVFERSSANERGGKNDRKHEYRDE